MYSHSLWLQHNSFEIDRLCKINYQLKHSTVRGACDAFNNKQISVECFFHWARCSAFHSLFFMRCFFVFCLSCARFVSLGCWRSFCSIANFSLARSRMQSKSVLLDACTVHAQTSTPRQCAINFCWEINNFLSISRVLYLMWPVASRVSFFFHLSHLFHSTSAIVLSAVLLKLGGKTIHLGE